MTIVSGVLSVREECDGGGVATELTELPSGWFGGASSFVLLVHGFNNDVDEAREAYSCLTNCLPDCFFPKVGWFYWPGDADVGWLDFLDFISYPTEIRDAQDSAVHLANALTRLARENPGAEVTLVGHSLGCRLIAECLNLLMGRPATDRPVIKALLFMAAAVPVELAGANEKLGQSLRTLAPNGYVFHSTDDVVLQLAFPAGQTLAAGMGYEDAIFLEPVGRHGNPENLFLQSPVFCSGYNHSDYWNAPDVIGRLCGICNSVISRNTEVRMEQPPRDVLYRSLPKWSAGECPML